MFIVFEGIDAAGKTTQIQHLHKYLTSLNLGRKILVTLEPGGTHLGTLIRNIVLHTEIDKRAEFLLYAADRAQNIASIVRPALSKGDIVLQDRYTDSSIAYQVAGRGLPNQDVREISNFASTGLVPHLTFIFDLNPKTAIKRIRQREAENKHAAQNTRDKFEAMDASFYARVRAEYLKIYEANQGNVCQVAGHNTLSEYCLINAEKTECEILDTVRTRTLELLKKAGYFEI